MLSFPLLAFPKLLFSPLDLVLYAEPEVLTPLEEADLSDEALPARRPPAERPTDTSWSGEVLYGLLNLSADACGRVACKLQQ